MALNNINLGTAANNGTGEDIRSGGGKINANFAFLDSNKTDKGNYAGTAGDLKTYVDTMLQGLKWKDSVLVATTANIALTGEQTIDGVLTAASRVLVKEQTTKTENGIYLTGAGAWTRTTDADANTELTSATVSIEQGTTLAGDIFTCNTSPITLGTTDIEFVSVSRGTVVTDHNALSGKQGGTSGEYNHLTNAELAKLQAAPATSEAAFTKNSAFNKNFGTVADTVAQGDDSRIINGQAAFDALEGKIDHRTIKEITTATYRVLETDKNKFLYFTNVAGATIEVKDSVGVVGAEYIGYCKYGATVYHAVTIGTPPYEILGAMDRPLGSTGNIKNHGSFSITKYGDFSHNLKGDLLKQYVVLSTAPTADTHAATKKYVDDKVILKGVEFSVSTNVDGHTIPFINGDFGVPNLSDYYTQHITAEGSAPLSYTLRGIATAKPAVINIVNSSNSTLTITSDNVNTEIWEKGVRSDSMTVLSNESVSFINDGTWWMVRNRY